MKDLYTSPVITVEELSKIDVLCNSTEVNTTTSDTLKFDNINQKASTLVDFTRFM